MVSWFKRRILGDQREHWNHQYAAGHGEKLRHPQELARLDACAAQLHRHAATGSKRVLEIGCGEALLQQRVRRDDYQHWLGVDISDVAIAGAQKYANKRVRFIVEDMRTFIPQALFDAIIFPESIYYAEDRTPLLQRYAQFLTPDGVFIISIFDTKRSHAIWREIHAAAYPIYSDVTTNELGSWCCETLQPHLRATLPATHASFP